VRRPQVIDDEDHERVHERVAAIDVAKDSGMVCTRLPHPSRPGARRSTVLMTLAESPQSCSAEFPTLLGHQTT
jgi:transposase